MLRFLTVAPLRRLYCSEKLGALVVVVRSAHDPSIVGLRGVVVAESKHCFFIANYRKGHRERARKKTSGLGWVMIKSIVPISNECANPGDQEAQRQTSGPSEVAGKVPAAVVAPEACKETATAEPPRKEIASKQLKVARIVRAHCVLAVQWSPSESGPGGLAEDQEAARRRLLQLLIPAPSDSSSGSSSGSSGAVQLQPSLGQGGGESLSFLLHGEGVSSYFKSRAG